MECWVRILVKNTASVTGKLVKKFTLWNRLMCKTKANDCNFRPKIECVCQTLDKYLSRFLFFCWNDKRKKNFFVICQTMSRQKNCRENEIRFWWEFLHSSGSWQWYSISDDLDKKWLNYSCSVFPLQKNEREGGNSSIGAQIEEQCLAGVCLDDFQVWQTGC